MRILAVYRHFWPDSPPYASMLRTIAGALAADGHEVSVLAERPSYKAVDRAARAPGREVLDGVRVRRLARLPAMRRSAVRRLGAAVFPLRVVGYAIRERLRGRRYDVLWTATMPPAINGAGARLAARILGARFVYHLQDIYPELQTFSGKWRETGTLARITGWLDARNVHLAACNVTLSDDMATTIQARGVPADRVRVIANIMPDSFDEETPLEPALAKLPGRFRVIFAGNVGRFQGLEALVEAARLLRDERPEVEFLVLGEGAMLGALREAAADLPNIRFEGHRPLREAKPVIATADAGLVSIQPGIYRAAYPSKTVTYLGLGVPLLAVVEPESELARSIVEGRLGWVAPSGDGEGLAAAVRAAWAARDEVPAMRERARAAFEREFAQAAVLERWRALMRELEPSG